MRCAVLAVLTALAAAPAAAHESWINHGGFRNQAGEWCCGENDCFVVSATHLATPIPGYRLDGGEFVTEREAQPSPDGQFWRCKRPDGSRRCFFAPPEGE